MGTAWNLVARNRSYRLLLTAGLISLSGDWIFSIGMMFSVFAVTGSALAAGAIVFTALLPHFLLGSVAGVFADRWDRRTTMVAANVSLAVSLLPVLFVHGTGQLWIIYLTVAAQNSIAQLFTSAEAAFVPAVVPREELVVANALNGQNNQVARLVGSALGGVIAVAGGIMAVTVVNVASYAVAAALIAWIPAATGARRDEGAEPRTAGRARRTWREWADGVRLCGRDADLSALLGYRVLSNFGEGVLSALFAPFVIGVIGASGAQFGAVNGIQAVGGIVGGIAIATFAARAKPVELLGYGAMVFGVLALLFALYPLALPGVWPAFALLAVVGLPIAALNAGFYTLLQLRAPEDYRGRVFGAISAAAAAAMLLGTVLGSTLATTVGVLPLIAVQGVIHIVAGPLVLARLRRIARHQAAAVPVPTTAGPP
ncbi:MFS transporter [Actinophytocola sp.]|uniref:MFS transporter n=1 Tax=Actinophytocola sp. TaxID=1872138 RepID=UPI00389A244F